MERIRGWAARLRAFFSPPKRKPITWIVGEESVPEPEPLRPVHEVFSGFVAFWGRVRTRLFRVLAGLLVVADVALAVLLTSNVWYLNLLLYAILVPNFLILLHYLRLTRK